MSKLLLLIMILLFLAGCVQNTAMYYWGNYSNTLYAYKKNPSDETLNKHIESLQKIITTSNTYKKRVPPGIYAELAMLQKTQNKAADVSELLLLETKTYPESGKFVKFISDVIFWENQNDKN